MPLTFPTAKVFAFALHEILQLHYMAFFSPFYFQLFDHVLFLFPETFEFIMNNVWIKAYALLSFHWIKFIPLIIIIIISKWHIIRIWMVNGWYENHQLANTKLEIFVIKLLRSCIKWRLMCSLFNGSCVVDIPSELIHSNSHTPNFIKFKLSFDEMSALCITLFFISSY